MGGRVEYSIPPTEILAAYMDSKFQGGRHVERVAKITELEKD
jgi:ribose 5-phosphate isomerase RpiB